MPGLPYAAAALVLLLAACAGRPQSDPRTAARPPATVATQLAATGAPPATLLLVSLDGFRPDYLGRGITPNLDRMAAEGVRARWMTPSYPALTFPNHYTLVTGLRPDRHGIVNNTMRDPVLGNFSLADRAAVGDRRWWGGEPLWVTAQKAGLSTALMFWPGSESDIGGVRADAWYRFDHDLPIAQRVARVEAWLDRSPAQRPRLITLYLEHVDSAGHDSGPGGAPTWAAVARVDAAIGALLEHIRARGLDDAVNLVVVSDHGMAATSARRIVTLDDLVSLDSIDLVTQGQVVGLDPRPGRRADVEAALLGTHPHLQCWRKDELPARWHYGANPRVPSIVCQAHEGWTVLTRARIPAYDDQGAHGYDPDTEAMRAIFLARGPAFAVGKLLPAFDNVDVYPLLAHLLGVVAQPNDGDPRRLLSALRDAGPRTPSEREH